MNISVFHYCHHPFFEIKVNNKLIMNAAMLSLLGVLAGTLTAFSFIPQVVKTIKTKETRDISSPMYAILIIGFLLWIVYGVMRKDFPVIIANSISFFLAITILIFKIKNG